MLRVELGYWVLAAFLAGSAWLNARERRWAAAAFWGVLALLFGGGDAVQRASAAHHPLPAQFAGLGVLLLAVLAPRMHRVEVQEVAAAVREKSAERFGHRLLLPALLIPGATLLLTLAAPYLAIAGRPLFGDPPALRALAALVLACGLALAAAVWLTRPPAVAVLTEGRRLLDALGWAALLPLVLAALGSVFAASGVGDDIAKLVAVAISTHSRLACVLAYGLGMVIFTVLMGNAFAAFPVITGGVGLPLLVRLHGADPGALGALGMLAGYCGTLLTPMAANFNVVPTALLELEDSWSVIRVQWPTALLLLAVNLALMSVLPFL